MSKQSEQDKLNDIRDKPVTICEDCGSEVIIINYITPNRTLHQCTKQSCAKAYISKAPELPPHKKIITIDDVLPVAARYMEEVRGFLAVQIHPYKDKHDKKRYGRILLKDGRMVLVVHQMNILGATMSIGMREDGFKFLRRPEIAFIMWVITPGEGVFTPICVPRSYYYEYLRTHQDVNYHQNSNLVIVKHSNSPIKDIVQWHVQEMDKDKISGDNNGDR